MRPHRFPQDVINMLEAPAAQLSCVDCRSSVQSSTSIRGNDFVLFINSDPLANLDVTHYLNSTINLAGYKVFSIQALIVEVPQESMHVVSKDEFGKFGEDNKFKFSIESVLLTETVTKSSAIMESTSTVLNILLAFYRVWGSYGSQRLSMSQCTRARIR